MVANVIVYIISNTLHLCTSNVLQRKVGLIAFVCKKFD